MANDNKTVQLELMKLILEELPFGIFVTKNEKEIVLCNSILSEAFADNQSDLQMRQIIEKKLGPAVNVSIHLNDINGIVRKEIVQMAGEEYQIYLLFFMNNKNNISNINIYEEILYRDIIEFAYDGLVMVDKEGYVQMLSQAYADFLGVNQESAIGKHVTEVIENTRMHLVVQTGKQEVAELQKIKNNYMIATRSPILKQGKLVGAVGKVLFKNIGQLTALSKRVNLLEGEMKKYKSVFRERNKASYTFNHLIGRSPVFMEVKGQASIASKSESNVLILGESGTGKELFAHSIHNDSRRFMGVFVKVNCAAIPAELLESELFGYEEGAFTGAKKGGKVGKFETADGGTIFLDEIGELPLHMQVKLLRVLQEKEIERVGSTGSIPIDVRVIAATNRNLEEMVSKGEFRLDLYYRLKVMQIQVPSLRERSEDIGTLVNHFVAKYKNLMKKQVQGVSDQALWPLRHYSWPGNIRELENIIERAMNIVDEGDWIVLEHLPKEITGVKEKVEIRTLAEVMDETERNTILNCLEMTSSNKSEAAKLLGVSRTTLYEKMKKYSI